VYVGLSVCPIYQHAASLLLGAPRAGDIDRSLHGAPAADAPYSRRHGNSGAAARRSAANAGSVTLTSGVGS